MLAVLNSYFLLPIFMKKHLNWTLNLEIGFTINNFHRFWWIVRRGQVWKYSKLGPKNEGLKEINHSLTWAQTTREKTITWQALGLTHMGTRPRTNHKPTPEGRLWDSATTGRPHPCHCISWQFHQGSRWRFGQDLPRIFPTTVLLGL